LGLICLAIFFVFTPKKSIDEKAAKSAAVYKKIGLALLVGVVLAAGLIWLARDSRFVVNNPTFYRVTHISLQETTGQTRFLAWKMSLRGFVERPIFGWGRKITTFCSINIMTPIFIRLSPGLTERTTPTLIFWLTRAWLVWLAIWQ